MSRISTGVGLISGLDIQDIVSQLMAIEKRPIEQLQSRIDEIDAKKTVFLQLTAQLLQLKLTSDQMSGSGNVFTTRTALSSNTSVLDATASRGTPVGNYSFTVKSLVQSHQVVSRGFANLESTLGAGTITIEMGQGNVDRATPLDSLNAGAGVSAGSMLITDRSGASATIDLSGAVTVQDVLDEINIATGLSVTASVEGGHIVLTDTSGQTAFDLSVVEVGGGSAAADLGILASIAASTLTGSDIVSMSVSTYLDSLNDARGVRDVYGLDDLRITRRDGVEIDIDISSAETVHDVIDLVANDAANADGLLTLSLAPGGTALLVTDTTGGAGDLSVTALNSSLAAADLGLLASVSSDTLTGSRVVAGLNTVLLDSLNGGSGVAAGSIQITDRSGASDTVDLSSAGTLTEVIAAINASAVSVTASLNSSGTALVLTDSSGGAGDLAVAESGSTTAADLGILSSVSANTLTGTNLELQYVSEQTLLSSLNGGSGVYAGKFRITDRNGLAATVDLSQADDTRIEDVIAEINSRGIGVTASVNSSGDGIIITDTTGGSGDLRIVDLDGGTTAADLNIAGTASDDDPDHIDGSFEYTVTIEADDTIEEITAKIEDSGAPVSASIMNDGSATNPYRIAIVSKKTGSIGRMVIDSGSLDLDLFTTQAAGDAVVIYGQSLPGSNPMVVTSTSNSITGLIEGLTLNLTGTSDSPVFVSVSPDDDATVTLVSDFVNQWNAAVDLLQKVTSFDAETESAGILLGDFTVQRIEDMLHRMISYNAPAAAPRYNRLSRIGVTFMQTGQIAFDPSDLRAALAADRDDVETLFTSEETGLGDYFSSVIERLTDQYDGVIKRKNDLFENQTEVLQSQVESLADRLAKVQDRLFREFYAMEEALAKLQSQQAAIDNMPNYLISSTGRTDNN